MTDQAQVVEKVVNRMEGKKKFTYYARETVYYAVEVYAEDRDKADDIYYDLDGETFDRFIDDRSDFETMEVEEE